MNHDELNLVGVEDERPTFHIVNRHQFLSLCGKNVLAHRWTFPFAMRGRMEAIGPVAVCPDCEARL